MAGHNFLQIVGHMLEAHFSFISKVIWILLLMTVFKDFNWVKSNSQPQLNFKLSTVS